MYPSHFKGALLEYLIRKLLINCGFIRVKSDDLYTFEHGDLFFVNGKGAAHDADVLMEPPVQMPFSYPSRVLFECKAYEHKISLPIVRNALGLRYDINEFEIVTKDTLDERKNNRRASYAIEDRKRYNYSVGVAAINGFTKPSVEFAANNKIPLINLEWMLPESVTSLFNNITFGYIHSIPTNMTTNIYNYFKKKSEYPLGNNYNLDVINWLEQDEVIGKIVMEFDKIIDRTFIGLIETGDIIFLYESRDNSDSRFRHSHNHNELKAQIHYYVHDKNYWKLSVYDAATPNITYDFNFYIPRNIMAIWKKYNYDRATAIDLKQEYFSRIFLYKKSQHTELPFFVVNIDRAWLESVQDDLQSDLNF